MVEGAHTYAEHAYTRFVRKLFELWPDEKTNGEYEATYDELHPDHKELWLAVGEFIREQVEEASREGRE